MLKRVVKTGWITGFTIGSLDPNKVVVSHLLFVDGVIIFYDANQRKFPALKSFLICFEAVSGLQVNMGKCEMNPIGGEDFEDGLVGILGWKIGSFPSTYLGQLLESKYKSTLC